MCPSVLGCSYQVVLISNPPALQVWAKGTTPDPLDEQRWRQALDAARLLRPQQHFRHSDNDGAPSVCRSAGVVQRVRSILSSKDAVYLGHVWRLLDEHATEGMQYRVRLQVRGPSLCPARVESGDVTTTRRTPSTHTLWLSTPAPPRPPTS